MPFETLTEPHAHRTMLPRLSTLSLALGVTILPATVFAICTSGVLCGLNTRALVHKRFWGTCIQTNETDSHYVALTLKYAPPALINSFLAHK